MSTDNARTTTEDPDYDYGALIGDTDIDEHALLEFDPDAVDPDHIEDVTDLESGSIAEDFEAPEEVDTVAPEPDPSPNGTEDVEEFTPPEPVNHDPQGEADPQPDSMVDEPTRRVLDPAGAPVVAVCGLNGGAGTTTFAMLLAFAASKQKRGAVLLSDLGGPSASMAAYLSKRGGHSLASAANAHRAGLLGTDGKAPFAEVSNSLRLMAREPGLADDEISTSTDPYIYDLLVDAQEDHYATVIDCGRLERPGEEAVAEHATHIVWVVEGNPAAARRARAALRAIPYRGSRSSVLVVRVPGDGSFNDRAEKDVRHAADDADADIVLCSDAGDVVGQGLERTAKRAIQPVKATLGRVFK